MGAHPGNATGARPSRAQLRAIIQRCRVAVECWPCILSASESTGREWNVVRCCARDGRAPLMVDKDPPTPGALRRAANQNRSQITPPPGIGVTNLVAAVTNGKIF